MECGDDILPCPFCGSKNTTVNQKAGHYTVVCEACRRVGPVDSVQDYAVQRWNSRSALAASFGALSISREAHTPGWAKAGMTGSWRDAE